MCIYLVKNVQNNLLWNVVRYWEIIYLSEVLGWRNDTFPLCKIIEGTKSASPSLNVDAWVSFHTESLSESWILLISLIYLKLCFSFWTYFFLSQSNHEKEIGSILSKFIMKSASSLSVWLELGKCQQRSDILYRPNSNIRSSKMLEEICIWSAGNPNILLFNLYFLINRYWDFI